MGIQELRLAGKKENLVLEGFWEKFFLARDVMEMGEPRPELDELVQVHFACAKEVGIDLEPGDDVLGVLKQRTCQAVV